MKGSVSLNTDDSLYMKTAIELALKGRGYTAPNPMVGAVIVKNDKIIGMGYHKKCGELHAERNALASLSESAEGAVMYVTLEPCCHYGRTPPCTEAIIESRLSRVVIGSRDPNPLVSGRGAEMLKNAGIAVEQDFMRDECDKINPVFFHYITRGLPYVALKYAMTLDGKTASRTGKSKWITGEAARRHVHKLRGYYSVIMAGIGTVLYDDPMLNCRIDGAHQPTRVIIDSKLRIPLDSQICRTAGSYRTIIACADGNTEKAEKLKGLGIEAFSAPGKDGTVDMPSVIKYLAENKLDSVLVEGGGRLNESILREGLVNHVYAYIAPKIMGGESAKTPVEGLGAEAPELAARLKNPQITSLGDDILLEYDIAGGLNNVYRNC